MPKFAVGVDFGTLSARALVAEIGTGRELGAATMDYPHAVMTRALPNGTPLKPDWALQHPRDYLDCLGFVVPEALRRSGVDPADVVGMGIDCTASTSMARRCASTIAFPPCRMRGRCCGSTTPRSPTPRGCSRPPNRAAKRFSRAMAERFRPNG